MMDGLKKLLHLRTEAETYAASLPALVLEAEKIAASLTHGDHARRKAGSGQKFWQFRDYVTGDRPQDIDWRQSAKTDHVFIRQRELQTTQKTFFWCAAGKGMRYTSDKTLKTKQDCAVVLSLSLALLLMQAEEQIGVFGETRTGRSENMIEHISQFLINANHKENLPQSDHFILPRHSNLIMAGDFLAPPEEIESAFAKIAASAEKALVIQILDPSELDLDFQGRVLFEGETAQDKETINHVSSIRAQYQDRMKAHIDAIQKLCRQHNWPYILHRTDLELSQTLNTLWMMSSEQRGATW